MYLLNIFTRRLEYFQGDNIPPYAILSHRWGPDEVTFEDLRTGSAPTKQAYAKLDGCCRQAGKQIFESTHSLELDYVWIDTCCIDKSSSAELSEAINSMYRWYEDAAICYAYLSDVEEKWSSIASAVAISDSAWFSRGWTLQELIAPTKLVFFDRDWRQMGTREDFCVELASRTRIPEDVIQKKLKTTDMPAAAIFFWASKRHTTREEDRAYSLFGLLGVNMPLLYGEGSRAFHRLQEILLTTRNDSTVLAWERIADSTSPPTSIFANSPSDYGVLSGKLYPLSRIPMLFPTRGALLDSTGLSLSVSVVPLSYWVYFVPLGMTRVGDTYGMVIRRGFNGLFWRMSKSGTRCLFASPPSYLDESPYLQSLELTIARGDIQDYGTELYPPSYFRVSVLPLKTQFVQYRPQHKGTIWSELTVDQIYFGVSDIIAIRRPKNEVLFFLLGLDIRFAMFCLRIRTTVEDWNALNPAEIFVLTRRIPDQVLSLTNQNHMMRLVQAFQTRTKGQEQLRSEDHMEFFSVLEAETKRCPRGEETNFLTSEGIGITLKQDQGRILTKSFEMSAEINLDWSPKWSGNATASQHWTLVDDPSTMTDREPV